MLMNDSHPDAELYKIIRLTNNTDFDFTPEMGARFGGVPYPLLAGRSMLLPKPAAKLLAKHLARQVYIKKAPVYGPSETDGKGSDRALWTEEECLKLAETFLSEEYEEERKAPVSEAEAIAQKVQDLNKDFPEVDTEPTTYVTKADVIEELKKRKITFNARNSKQELEDLLKK